MARIHEIGVKAKNDFIFKYPSVVVHDLLAWWKHDEGTGTTIDDYIGTSDGELLSITQAEMWANNAPDGNPCGTYPADTLNHAVNDIGTGLALASGDITIVAACYFDTIDGSHNTVLSKRAWAPAGGTSSNYGFRREGTGGYLNDVSFYYYGTGWHVWTSDTGFLSTGNWYILTFTYTFGTGASSVLYNGTSVQTGDWYLVGDGTELPGATNQYVQIGGVSEWVAGNDDTSQECMRGRLGDILLYDTVLTTTEVTQNFNALRDRYGL
jgi:hypothetical protein